MKALYQFKLLVVGLAFTVFNSTSVVAQDWPQWRGPNRDAVAASFKTPDSWPKSLSKKWSVNVGDGVSSPSTKDGKVYVIALQDGNEVMRCLEANTGKEIWKDSYPAKAASGPASSFPGTRASPAVADDKVVAFGVDGTISCWNVSDGKLAWRNDNFKGQVPRFSTSSSPLIADETCLVEIGSDRSGGIVAFDLDSGDEKWKWTGDGASYGSPVLMSVDDTKVVVAPTAGRLVVLDLSSGDELWEMEYRQGRYNAATPVVDGQTVIFAGPERGLTAIEFSKSDGKLSGKEKWRNEDTNATLMFNSPVLAEGMLFGLSSANNLFCVNAANGETTWSNPISGQTADRSAGGQQQARGADRGERGERGDRGRSGEGGQERRRGGRRGGRGGGSRGGYGSIVSAGSVLFGLTPTSELVVYEADRAGFKELARYKVSETPTYAYPVLATDGIYIKDKDSLALWFLE